MANNNDKEYPLDFLSPDPLYARLNDYITFLKYIPFALPL